MHPSLFSNPEALAKINLGLDYLRDLHEGKSPVLPDIRDEEMAAAMTVWLNARKHLANNIKADFDQISKAEASGKSITELRTQLAGRVEAFNGIFLPEFMSSAECALSTPLEGWLFATPPQRWRLSKKIESPLNPIDRPSLFFKHKKSFYLRMLDSVQSLDHYSAAATTMLNGFLFSLGLALLLSGRSNVLPLLAEACLFGTILIFYLGKKKEQTRQ